MHKCEDMKYIKFILKCILAISPAIILIAYTLLCPFCYMDVEYPAWRFTKDVVDGRKFASSDFDTVILGDSGAMSSFVPELLSDSCINLAVGGGTSIEMYYFFKKYIDVHAAPSNVVIMYQPFHYFNIDNYETRTMYFKALDIKDSIEVISTAKKCQAKAVYKEGVLVDELSCRTGLPTKYLPAISAARFIGRRYDNKIRYDSLIRSRGYGTFGTLDGCDDASYESSYEAVARNGDSRLIAIYYKKLLDLCRDEGIPVTIIQPAFNEATYNALNPDYYQDYRSYVNELCSEYSNVTCEDEIRCYDNSLFGDVSHLNSDGARVFSNEIKQKYSCIFK